MFRGRWPRRPLQQRQQQFGSPILIPIRAQLEDRRELRVTALQVVSAAPAKEIVEYATANHMDLLIVGTHGRGPVAHLFMGSVAERVVRGAPCPVLTVRHPEHEFLRADALEAVSVRV